MRAIRNAILINEGRRAASDVVIAGGRIVRVGPAGSAPRDIPGIDATGLLLLPGLIDDQVHFREPGPPPLHPA
jgi:dihydroorotase